MKKDKIINLVGASGSGKTTIARELEKTGYNIIESYTTRKPRSCEEWGHKFVSTLSDDFSLASGRVTPNEEVIAYREVYAGVYYWATWEQVRGKGTSIYVIEPIGAEEIKKRVKNIEVITVFLFADEVQRIQRMKLQGRTVEEIKDRIIDDKKIFKAFKCDYVIDANRDFKVVLRDIVELIEKK